MKGFFIITLLFASAMVQCSGLPPQRPVIGIYTQAAEKYDAQESFGQKKTYIAASYIKNIQMTGALVVPLFYHYTHSQLDDILGKINGVFFPGGEMPIDISNQWTNNTAYILEYANKKNKEGIPYPIWATCLGYEAIMYITSGNTDNTTVFTEVFGQDGKTCALDIKNQNSDLLKSLNSKEYQDAVSGQGIFFFHHRWSVLADTFYKNSAWVDFWNLISTSYTSDNVEFLSTLQAKQYPYFLTQYHPQKNCFEWRVPASRTYNAVSATQNFINTFINVARRNPNTFPESQLAKKVINNYKPTLTPLDYSFVSVYIFDESQI